MTLPCGHKGEADQVLDRGLSEMEKQPTGAWEKEITEGESTEDG